MVKYYVVEFFYPIVYLFFKESRSKIKRNNNIVTLYYTVV